MPALTQLNATIRAEVLKRYQKNQPKPGNAEFEAWAESVSDQLGITVPQVKRAVADEQGAYLFNIRRQAASDSQKIAQMLGATQVRALDVFNQAMGAEEVTFLKDRHGDPVLKDGVPVEVHNPLWGIRLKAAENVTKIHGGFAPEQLQVEERILFADLSSEQLLEKLNDTRKGIESLTRELAAATAGGAGARARGDGPAGRGGQVVLADPVHEDS